MGDFVNYTPGEYAKEHIRITPTTLADGRDFFYLDDDPEYVSGVKTRELKDPRQLPYRFSNQLNAAGEEVPYAAPEMRRDPLTGDWIPMATARMNRPITAGPGATAKGNPLAARKPGDPYQDGEVPDTDYNVVVFENRFPSMVRVPGRSEAVEYVNGNPLWEKKLAAGRCEVICFDPDEDGLPADLPVSRLRTVVEAWAFRTAEISKMEGIEQIFPFENHGQEIGVSLAHPHGQVYCYPFIAPKMEAELKQTEAYHEKTGGNLLKDLMNAEIEAGERIVMRNHSWVAYVPAAARWPLEVHVAPVRDVLTLDELNDQERWGSGRHVLHPAQARQRVLRQGRWQGHGPAVHRCLASGPDPRQAPRELPPQPAVLLVPPRRQQDQVSGRLRIRHGRMGVRHHAGTHRQALPRARTNRHRRLKANKTQRTKHQ